MSQDEGFAELLRYELKNLQDRATQDRWNEHLLKTLSAQELSCNENNKVVDNIENELSEVKALADHMSGSRKHFETLVESSHDLQSKCDALRLQNKSLKEKIKKKTAEYEKEKASVESQRKQIDEKRVIINASSELFERLLGLEIRVLNGNRMQFVFKSSNPENHDSFIIISLNERIYRITESYPMLENLKSLEDALNKTNNLAGFIQHSRMLLKNKLQNLEESGNSMN